MRTSYIALVLAVGFGLMSCNRHDSARREEPAARQLGREAHDASQDIKRGAKDAAKELRKAGQEFRQGWNEAKHDEPADHKKARSN